MKKQIISGLLAVVACFGMTSCGGAASPDPETIKIQFVPSRDAGKLAGLAKELEPVLERFGEGRKFELTVGESFTAAAEALVSNQVDAAFLTATSYAQFSLMKPGSVDVLLTSTRSGYKVQLDDYPNDPENQMKAMNGEIEGYSYHGEKTSTAVDYYDALCYVRRDRISDINGDGKIDIRDTAGLNFAFQGTGSGSGYLRPKYMLHQAGIEMVSNFSENKAHEVKVTQLTSYDAALKATMQGDVDGFWGYIDVRCQNGWEKADSDYYQDETVFSSTEVVAISDHIYNDTITGRGNLSDKTKEIIRNAFLQAVNDGDKDTAGTGAYYLYNIYNHSGYKVAKDSDYDGERSFYQFCVDNDLLSK